MVATASEMCLSSVGLLLRFELFSFLFFFFFFFFWYILFLFLFLLFLNKVRFSLFPALKGKMVTQNVLVYGYGQRAANNPTFITKV